MKGGRCVIDKKAQMNGVWGCAEDFQLRSFSGSASRKVTYSAPNATVEGERQSLCKSRHPYPVVAQSPTTTSGEERLWEPPCDQWRATSSQNRGAADSSFFRKWYRIRFPLRRCHSSSKVSHLQFWVSGRVWRRRVSRRFHSCLDAYVVSPGTGNDTLLLYHFRFRVKDHMDISR